VKRPFSFRTIPLTDDPTWYKDAIIYELRTRSFYDSNDDGIGDFRGLASKLDYLLDLGVTALWLLPFYPSPGKDDGYDIADYGNVSPEVGTLADFEYFLGEAHRRGLRVITELVLNHTSDQHPWFQRARRAPPGSPERDFYVWSDTPDRYRDARIIFQDFEPSNWSWDRLANSYYWHRFYSHQPDLNFENPAVQEALLGVVDFWLEKGVDGLRLDAVPYLYEEEGTNCENLPKTHAFLKKLRAHIDAKFKNRMLLAEANQWPEDAAAYFGKGDECHMNFHFPLMPRMFMAIHMEDRLPLVDIFAQTPEVDPTCQWALFLRNHDELTLEMVTDEERDYMYRAYAHQTAMRINLGIRRRLAPLVENNRRKIELLNGLLLSLPGTPVLYYGDEIGMGDNVYLGDRNGVRTPMQWSLDRNAGFSRANPQRLILPVVIDPEYHYESLNVENQQANPTSLLWWTKRLVALRKRFRAFGRGSMEFLTPTNSRVLAYVRSFEDSHVLVVANLSRFVQYAELDLSKFKGATPIELFGKTRFPEVGTAAYPMTLGPHGFYWFSLDVPGAAKERMSLTSLAAPVECSNVEAVLFGEERPLLDDAIRAFLESRRWVAVRDLAIRSARVEEAFRVGPRERETFLLFARVDYTNGESELVTIPLGVAADLASAPTTIPATSQMAQLEMKEPAGKGILFDALEEPATARAVLEAFTKEARLLAGDYELAITAAGSAPPDATDLAPDPAKLGRERNDTVVRYGERFLLKTFRHLLDQPRPELEIGRLLTGKRSDLVPQLLGAIELRAPRAQPMTVGLIQSFVPNVGTAWDFTTQELGRYFDRVLARPPTADPVPTAPEGSPLALIGVEPPASIAEMVGSYRDSAHLLGERVAELHVLLRNYTADPDFAPEPYTTLFLRSKYQGMRNLNGMVFRLLRERLTGLAPPARAEAEKLITREADVLKQFDPLLRLKTNAVRMRVHGNLHLGHILYTGKTFVMLDFDGFREMTIAERRRKRMPLVDVAAVLRSLEFASIKVLFDPARVRDTDREVARSWAHHWSSWVSASFLRGYLEKTAGANVVPSDPSELAVLLQAFSMQRELQQLRGHVEDRSDNTLIALLSVARMLGGS
jgi:maltose alpha-D-glucosyltransferase/alpha-amylase